MHNNNDRSIIYITTYHILSNSYWQMRFCDDVVEVGDIVGSLVIEQCNVRLYCPVEIVADQSSHPFVSKKNIDSS